MSLFIMMLMAALLMMTAAYAHLRLPRFTAGAKKLALARTVLVLTGIGFGLVSAAGYADDPVRTLLAILIGFGAVHAPAAIILLVKQGREAGKS